MGNATKLTYDANAAKVISVKDANLKVTTLAYSDWFDRLTNVTDAVGGGTNIGYPAAYWTVVYHDKASNFDRAYQDQSVTDGLGRVTETRHILDSQNLVAVDRSYDALGRVK